MNSIEANNNYKDKNEYCSVRSLLPENPNTNKAVIVLPGLMYRGWSSTGDLDTLVREDAKAAHIHFDYPKTEFVMDKVITQIKDYIHNCPYDEIIIIGISFGDIVYRNLINQLSIADKNKVKHHISLNGVSNKDELSLQFKIMLSMANIKSKTLNNLTGLFGIKNREYGGVFTNNQVYNKEFKNKIKENPKGKEKLLMRQKHHQKSASLGFTPGYADRARVIAGDKSIASTDIPTSMIYSNNDEFFANPKRNAQKIGETIVEDVDYYEVEKGGHIALVEYPEKYNPVLKDILAKVWSKDLITDEK